MGNLITILLIGFGLIQLMLFIFLSKVITLNRVQLKSEISEIVFDNLKKLYKDLNMISNDLTNIENAQRKMAEVICYRIRKLEEQSNEVKTGIDKVADNVNDISLKTNSETTENVENEDEEKYITYEEMIRDYQADRQIDYRHQVSRLQKQLELLEYDYEKAINEKKIMKDEIIRLKAGLDAKQVQEELSSEVVDETNYENVTVS